MFWGNPDVIGALLAGPLPRMMGPTSCLAGYRMNKVTVFMPKEEALGARAQGFLNVERPVVLLSPGSMKTCLSYMVCHIGWCPALIASLVGCLDVARVFLK